MGAGNGGGPGFFPDVYSEEAEVGIVFEGLSNKDIQKLEQTSVLNVNDASHKIQKRSRLLRRPTIKLLYQPEREIKQKEFNKKLGTVLENVTSYLKKGFTYFFIHRDPAYGVTGISAKNKAIYEKGKVTFSIVIG